jgi:toxin ParE1/3/4
MAYKIIVSLRAFNEIDQAIDYYALYSADAPVNFLKVLKSAYAILETNPFFRTRYKNVRAIKLKRFPYSLYYIININNNTVRVLSCFHNKRNPQYRPQYR